MRDQQLEYSTLLKGTRCWPAADSNLGPLDSESSAVTARPRAPLYLCPTFVCCIVTFIDRPTRFKKSQFFYWVCKCPRGGGHLYFNLDIILVKGLSKHTLNTYFSGMIFFFQYTGIEMVNIKRSTLSIPVQIFSKNPRGKYPFLR